jgi:hypothetical protein
MNWGAIVGRSFAAAGVAEGYWQVDDRRKLLRNVLRACW